MTYSPTGRVARDPVETILREDTVPYHVVEVGDQYFLGLESGRQRRLHGRFGDPTDPTSSDGAPTGQVATERERLGRKRARAQLDREALQPQGLGLVAPGIRQDRRQGRGEIQEASAATAGQEAGGLRRAPAKLLTTRRASRKFIAARRESRGSRGTTSGAPDPRRQWGFRIHSRAPA